MAGRLGVTAAAAHAAESLIIVITATDYTTLSRTTVHTGLDGGFSNAPGPAETSVVSTRPPEAGSLPVQDAML